MSEKYDKRRKRKPERRCSQCGRTFRAKPCGFSHAAIGRWEPKAGESERRAQERLEQLLKPILAAEYQRALEDAERGLHEKCRNSGCHLNE
jgi:hypothetical protein